MKTEAMVEIEASPESVWEVISDVEDVERWPEWTESIDRVELLDSDQLAPGVRARIKQPKMPAMTWHVTELETDKGFAWTASAIGTRTVATHTILPTQRGSRVHLAVEQSGALFSLMPWVKSMTRRYVEMEAQGLKRRSEARANTQ